MANSFKYNRNNEYVFSWMWDINSTQKLFDELNETLAADNKGIGKLINKYSLTGLGDTGYGCTCFEIEFDPSLEDRDESVRDQIEEYLHDLICSSDWMADYMPINVIDEDGIEVYINDYCDGNLAEAVNRYIDALDNCDFGDDADVIYEAFADYPEAEKMIEQRLMMDALSGKFIRKQTIKNGKTVAWPFEIRN